MSFPEIWKSDRQRNSVTAAVVRDRGRRGLVRLQRTPQRLDGSGPLASRQQGRNRLHQPHHSEELTLRDVMNDRLVPVRLEDVLRSRLHQVGAEPAESLAETDPRRWLVIGHFPAEGAHPGGVEVSRSQADRAVGGLPGPAEQTRAAHPHPVTIQVGQPREHVADGPVDRRARLVPNGGTGPVRHLPPPSRVLLGSLDLTHSGRVPGGPTYRNRAGDLGGQLSAPWVAARALEAPLRTRNGHDDACHSFTERDVDGGNPRRIGGYSRLSADQAYSLRVILFR